MPANCLSEFWNFACGGDSAVPSACGDSNNASELRFETPFTEKEYQDDFAYPLKAPSPSRSPQMIKRPAPTVKPPPSSAYATKGSPPTPRAPIRPTVSVSKPPADDGAGSQRIDYSAMQERGARYVHQKRHGLPTEEATPPPMQIDFKPFTSAVSKGFSLIAKTLHLVGVVANHVLPPNNEEPILPPVHGYHSQRLHISPPQDGDRFDYFNPAHYRHASLNSDSILPPMASHCRNKPACGFDLPPYEPQVPKSVLKKEPVRKNTDLRVRFESPPEHKSRGSPDIHNQNSANGTSSGSESGPSSDSESASSSGSSTSGSSSSGVTESFDHTSSSNSPWGSSHPREWPTKPPPGPMDIWTPDPRMIEPHDGINPVRDGDPEIWGRLPKLSLPPEIAANPRMLSALREQMSALGHQALAYERHVRGEKIEPLADSSEESGFNTSQVTDAEDVDETNTNEIPQWLQFEQRFMSPASDHQPDFKPSVPIEYANDSLNSYQEILPSFMPTSPSSKYPSSSLTRNYPSPQSRPLQFPLHSASALHSEIHPQRMPAQRLQARNVPSHNVSTHTLSPGGVSSHNMSLHNLSTGTLQQPARVIHQHSVPLVPPTPRSPSAVASPPIVASPLTLSSPSPTPAVTPSRPPLGIDVEARTFLSEMKANRLAQGKSETTEDGAYSTDYRAISIDHNFNVTPIPDPSLPDPSLFEPAVQAPPMPMPPVVYRRFRDPRLSVRNNQIQMQQSTVHPETRHLPMPTPSYGNNMPTGVNYNLVPNTVGQPTTYGQGRAAISDIHRFPNLEIAQTMNLTQIQNAVPLRRVALPRRPIPV